MAGGVNSTGSAVVNWFKSAASSVSGGVKKIGSFLHFKKVSHAETTATTKTSGKFSQRPRPQTKITERLSKQLAPNPKVTTQARGSVSPASSAQNIRLNLIARTTQHDKQLVQLQVATERKDSVGEKFKLACDEAGISPRDALKTKRFPRLQSEFARAVNSEKLAQGRVDRLNELIHQSEDIISRLEGGERQELEAELRRLLDE